MAMFLPDSSAGAAMRSVSGTAARLSGLTSMGAPAHPSTPVSIGTGGVSFMPVNAPPPTAVAGRPTPVRRLDSRKQVTLEKNPRIGLHYCVELDAAEDKPDVGELCFLDTTSAGGWSHPKLLTLSQVHAELCAAGSDDADKRLAQLSPVGVFNTDAMNVSSGYGGIHVAIDTQRYASIRDYWPIDARAGERLWITFTKKGQFNAHSAEPGAKRARCPEVSIYCLSARGYVQAKEMTVELAAKEKTVDKTPYEFFGAICVGVVQNRLPADPVYGSAGKACKFSRSMTSQRKREIHLCLNENVWIGD